MSEQENIGDKFWKKFDTVKRAGEQISQALEEGVDTVKRAREKISQAWEEEVVDTFNSVQGDILNFDLLEEDIKNIHRRLERNGFSVLGSSLIIDDKKDLMEIKTYSKKGEKTFVNKASAKVKVVTNIPADILAEMKSKGRVELSLKFDD